MTWLSRENALCPSNVTDVTYRADKTLYNLGIMLRDAEG